MSTLTISHNNWLIRFYRWSWNADLSKLTVCKLFWGTVLFWFGFPGSKRTFFGVNPFAIFAFLHMMVFGGFNLFLYWYDGLVLTLYIGMVLVSIGILSLIIGILYSLLQTRPVVEFAGRVIVSIAGPPIRLMAMQIAPLFKKRTTSRIDGFIYLVFEFIVAIVQRVCPRITVV